MKWMMFLLVPALAGCLTATEDSPDKTLQTDAIVYHGGTIWTGAEDPFVDAVAVRGSDIVYAGPLNGAPPGERVHLNGRMMVPGFHDTHTHLLDAVLSGNTDVTSASPTTFDPVQGTANQQVIGSIHVCHWGVQHGESAGESLLGHLPPDQATALGDNLARETCYQQALTPRPSQAELGATWAAIEAGVASVGITTSVQAGFEVDDYEALSALAHERALRWPVYLWPEALRTDHATGDGPDRMPVLGIKIYTDGWLGPRTAAVHANYEDRPHNGFQFYEQGELDALVQQARDQGLKVTAHAIGDRAVDAVLAAYAAAGESNCRAGPSCGDPRFSIEHASVVQGLAIDHMAALNVVPSVQLSFPTSDAHWIDNALGEGSGIPYPWQTMTQKGIRLAGSSDWPIEVLQPLWGIERAVTRQEVDDSLPAAWQAGEGISVDQALRMVTVNAAYLEFAEHQTGALLPGLAADFVILSDDLFAISPDTIADVTVVETWVAGQRVH